jgi:hypothetical protein
MRHRHRQGFTTAIYVLYYPSIVQNRPYTYISEDCSRQAFVATEGLAWVDLGAKMDEMLPEYDIPFIPWPNLKDKDFSNTRDYHELAAFIHRSVEALVNFV